MPMREGGHIHPLYRRDGVPRFLRKRDDWRSARSPSGPRLEQTVVAVTALRTGSPKS